MVEINCGAIPEALLESELFGYESGAFTGADKRGKSGLIEMSDGGTLFLDEISELPLTLQVKLLHFLQNKRIIRVGGTQEIPIDVRVIAASNKSLKGQVDKGLFRSDLFYRLNVIPIDIPPLRERREDIIPMAQYFVNKYSDKNGKKIYLDESTLDYLQKQVWRGNIRELENSIERLVVTNGAVSMESIEPTRTDSVEEPAQSPKNEGPRKLNDIERDMIIRTYEKYKSSYKGQGARD
jgi:transcriptional regulator with PAS, ATPase and Fis domain